jgi:DUF1680 family protein
MRILGQLWPVAWKKPPTAAAHIWVKAPEERWTNLAECHELYCAGHMIEAGVAFFQATGKRVCWTSGLADQSIACLAPEMLHGYPGHPEIARRLVEVLR